ncbi:MAG: hypothetical protein NTW14_04375 [bacterium]|nr:hypothetical protein [bacterium]
MPVSETIKKIEVKDEFRVCPVCGHDSGFSVSLQHLPALRARIILICPECGARFDVDWTIDLQNP